MLNDVVLLEAAQGIAKRVGRPRCDRREDRVDLPLPPLCLVRPPTADEIAAGAKFYESQQAPIRDRRQASRGCRDAGEGRTRPSAPPGPRPPARILNLDEFITKE